MIQQQELPIGQNPSQMITIKQIGISVIVGLLLSVFFNSGPYFGKEKYYIYRGTEKIELSVENADNYSDSLLIEHETNWDKVFYGYLTYLFIGFLLLGYLLLNKSRSKSIKKLNNKTFLTEPTHQTELPKEVVQIHLNEQKYKASTIKPTLNEYMNNNQSSKKDSTNFSKILYLSLAICTVGIILFLWVSSSQNEYSSISSESTINEKPETKSKVAQFIGVDEYLNEMNSGNTQIYSVANHPKAFGADWQMRIPNSFIIIPGDKTHVISKFGTKDFNPNIAIGIGAHKLRISDEIHLSKDDINDFFNDPSVISDIVQEKGIFISGNKIVIDGVNPGYMSEIEYDFTNIDNSIKMRSLIFMFIVNKIIFTVTFNVATQDPDENLKDKMDQHRNFYNLIANTIIINGNEMTDTKHSFSKGILNRDNVNLRTIPELGSHIVALVNTGEEFYIVDKSEEETTIPNLGTNYWYLVENDNYKGWVFGKFLDIQ